MTETQRRIKAYQQLLPALRERVIAVALLLAMSASMLSSASFAWLTLSRSPEVTAVNTTVAANGNLEIALATGDLYTAQAPGESQVGDSTATKGQSVTAANITWGNLVNLADPSYGLDQMVLRPAQLNQSSLLKSPLYGARYGEDGRTQELSSDFAFATWEPANEEANTEAGFSINNKLGVRAITSVVYQQNQGTAYQAKQKRDAAESINASAGTAYLSITQDKDLMGSLATIMGVYLTASLGESVDPLNKSDVKNLAEIFRLFIEAYELQIEAMVKLANFQLFVLNNSAEGSTAYQEYTVESLMADSTTESNLYAGVKLPGLNQMKADYKKLKYNYSDESNPNATILELAAKADTDGTLAYSEMEHIVDSLINVGTCLVGDKTVNYLASNKSEAVSLVMGGGTHNVKITNGVLYNFEKLNGARAEIKNMSIKAKYMVSVTLNANITTNAPTPHQFQEGLDYGDGKNKGGALTGYSQDTYGLAIDLWVRTNAEESYLTLEGNVLTEKEEVYPTVTVNEDVYTVKLNGTDTEVYPVTDADGNTTWYKAGGTETVDLSGQTPTRTTQTSSYDLYTISVTEEKTLEDGTTESYTYSVDIYQKTKANGEKAWFNASSHTEYSSDYMSDKSPTRKVEVIETVIGYEGENRVWDRDTNSTISADATTQGSGSCYVYYADTPEDQARSLALLEAFKVAFVSSNGELLATASMDTAHHYATTGRVIVPLKLDDGNSIKVTVDESTGETAQAITALTKNEPMRITALVYLDGTKLYNENVLAAADIQGRLNIQFGSSERMEPIQNLELAEKVRTVSASLSRTQFDFDDETDDMTVDVAVKVDGDMPNTVTAFFLREINSSQGSREETMTFTLDESTGTWVSSYKFHAPGKYVLRSVQLDGVEVDLPLDASGQPLRATVEGFAVEALTCREGNHLSVMTASATQNVNLELRFATSDPAKMPKTVQGRYLREDGTAVNVDFTYTGGNSWTGAATFVASGNYTMQYLIMDGNYTELSSGMWLTADLTMGMRVWVDTTSPTQFVYIPDKLTDNQKTLGMQVKIMDGEGNELKSMAGAYLYYAKAGTTELSKGLSAQLTWDPSQDAYIGSFNSKIGIFNFNSVTVGSNTLTNATNAPGFRILSPEPPSFNYDATPATQYTLGQSVATAKVYINESDTATVWADFLRSDLTDTIAVRGELLSDGTWTFNIPAVDGTQDGNWTIKKLRVSDAYDKDGNEYTEEAPLVFSSEEYSFVTTKVISKAYVTLITNNAKYTVNSDTTTSYDWDTSLGADETKNGDTIEYTTTGAFLTSYSIDDLQVKIEDFEGNPINGVTLDMTYTYGGETYDYGGYQSAQVYKTSKYRTVTFAQDTTDSTLYTQVDPITVNQAGTYTPILTYYINGKVYQVDESAFAFSVRSKGADVKVTGTDPAPGTTKRLYTLKNPDNVNQAVQGDFFKFSDYYAAVYLYTNLQSGTFDQEAAHAYTPKVTLGLSGVPAGYSTGTMEFVAANTDSSSSTFTFSNGTATAAIGKVEDGSQGWFGVDTYPKLYPAGTMTQNQITLKYGDITYVIDLENTVTISQPMSPTVLKFLGIPDEYTGTKPSQVLGDGSTVTVTLPKLSWTARIEEPLEGEWSDYTAVGEVTDSSGSPVGRVYGYNEYTVAGRCGDTTYYQYQYYNWTKFQSSITANTNIYNQDREIAYWSINGTLYKAGETISLTSDGAIFAYASVSNVSSKVLQETVTQTTVKTLYGYVLGDAASPTSEPTMIGKRIGEKQTSQGATLPTVKLANATTADAATDTVGTNMTKDSENYEQFWP